MEINLRKANAIQAEIRRAISNAVAKNTLSVSEYTADVAGVLEKAKQEFVTETKRKVALTTALYNIRKSVGQANATAGINDILADVQAVEAEMAIFSNIGNETVAKSLDEITARIQKIKDAPVDSPRAALYGERYNNVDTSVVEESTIAHAKERVKELKRQRQNLQDKLLALNVNTLITIGGVDENVLKLEGIL
jgi:uncharacterized protein YdcH (DUF465 family)